VSPAISAAQLAASRANGALSGGPVTAAGKRRSSLNAIRHGLTGRVVVLPTEDFHQFEAFSQELMASLDPRTPLEREFAQTVVEQQWRLKRIRSIEDCLFAAAHFEPAGDFAADSPETHAAVTTARAFREHAQAFVNLSTYEQRIYRTLERALAQLRQLQAERQVQEQAQLEEAVKFQKLHEMKGEPFDPAAVGFVYSTAAIGQERARQTIRQEAQIAQHVGYDLARFRSRAVTLAPHHQKEHEKLL
jgi:hypothetical protein